MGKPRNTAGTPGAGGLDKGGVSAEPMHATGCMVCGAPLEYRTGIRQQACHVCGLEKPADARCARGHFICDACHTRGTLDRIRSLCLASEEADMLRLFHEVRSGARLPMHGPEHHALVPGVILATCRNLGGPVTREDILAGIERGTQVPGGFCGFVGACGAALGVGIAFGIIAQSTPLTPGPRQTLHRVVAEVVASLADRKAARCCQRECHLALVEAARLSRNTLPVVLRADHPSPCGQAANNPECIRKACTLYPAGAGT